MCKNKRKYYAVRRGRAIGIFLTWGECKKQVDCFPSARYKSFPTIEEAELWLTADDATCYNLDNQAELNELPVAEETAVKEKSQTVVKVPPPKTETRYIAYTDGSCLVNPNGPGGWATVIIDTETGETVELSQGCPGTTNNRMEMEAAIAAMSFPDEPSSITIYTDSQYLKNGFAANWITGWKKRGWVKSNGQPVLNQDLWQKLDALYQTHQVKFQWVKGHAGNTFNERCDELARGEAMKFCKH